MRPAFSRMINLIHIATFLALVLILFPQATFAKDELSRIGRIEARPGSGTIGNWIIAGSSYSVTAATVLKEELGPLSVGVCAEVKYTSSGSSNTATRIERQLESACGGSDTGGEQQVYAVIQSVPAGNLGTWQIGGKSYTSTSSTRLRQEHGSFAVGVCAEVEFTSNGGSNTATSISTEDAFRCSNGTFLNQAVGTIQAFPSGLVGTWQIGGETYQASAATQFQQRTPFAVGSCVKVSYFVQSGASIAQEIESEGADDCSGTPSASTDDARKLYAPIETLPASPFVGAWRIGGVDFSATSATRFEQNAAPFAVGVCVEAAFSQVGGTFQLGSVESKPSTRCQVGGANALRAYGAINSLPSGLVGTWQIGGVTYQATAGTSFEQRFGRFAVGAFTEVVYRLENGTRIATKIETHVAPGSGQIRTVGALESRPSDDTGTWVISGVSYTGDDAIEIEIENEHTGATHRAAPAATTTLVMVNGYQNADGTLVATSISTAQQVFAPLLQR